jgi:hypothetical protein
MDIVHHLVFKENVFGTDDFLINDNGQNPVLLSVKYHYPNPFELTQIYIIYPTSNTHIHTMFPCVTALFRVASS